MIRTEFALAAFACAAFAAWYALGASVSRRTPARLDTEAVALRGVGTPIAAVFTQLGYWPALTVFGALVVGLTWTGVDRAWLPAALVASHALSQTAIVLVKPAFHRTRPDYWLVRHEADTSYPSGHASTAVTFYAALALLTWHARLPEPLQIAASVALAACVAGIPWSRLALGAHYLSDVIGGLTFGSAWLAASLAIGLRFVR